MKRRDFFNLIGVAAATWPFSSQAQMTKQVPKIGVLWHAANEQEEAPYLNALRRGLRDLGYVEGHNIVLENRFANEQYERFNAQAAELAALKVNIIVAVTRSAAIAAQRATSTIPIVFILVADPVANKLVASFNRPGGNLTGLSQMALDLTGKRLEIFKEAVGMSRLAFLVNPGDRQYAGVMVDETESAARQLNMTIRPIEVSKPSALEDAFSAMVQDDIKAVSVINDAMFWTERKQIATLAMRHKMPSMFAIRAHVDDGGLISYGPSYHALFHRGAAYIDKILKGEKPADLPVERPTKFELVINMKTAKALGVEISPTVLAHVDEVIE
jgi:putative ABC transport system substrate-binding protein